jgi:hypothetical protein
VGFNEEPPPLDFARLFEQIPKGLIGGGQIAYHVKTGFKIGTNFVYADAENFEPFMVGSAFGRYITPRTDFFGTLAIVDSGGYSGYFRLKFFPRENWEIGGEYRNYHEYYYPYSNAPRYEGISGGNDNNETGYAIRLGYRPVERVALYAKYDYNDDNVTDDIYHSILGEIRVDLASNTTLTYSHESEYVRNDSASSDVVLLSFQFENGARLSGGFSYDKTVLRDFSTSRFYFRYPLIREQLFSTVQYTYRTGVLLGKSNPRIGIDWRCFGNNNLSVRYSYYDDAPDAFDMLLYIKF